MKKVLGVCVLLSVFDAIATINGHSRGFIQEANTVMDFYLTCSYLLFFLVKLYLTAIFGWLFYIAYYKYKKLYVKFIAYVITVMYALLAVYHIFILTEVYRWQL